MSWIVIDRRRHDNKIIKQNKHMKAHQAHPSCEYFCGRMEEILSENCGIKKGKPTKLWNTRTKEIQRRNVQTWRTGRYTDAARYIPCSGKTAADP